jgi:hypothetical protein
MGRGAAPDGWQRTSYRLAAVALIALIGAACTAAVSPSPATVATPAASTGLLSATPTPTLFASSRPIGPTDDPNAPLGTGDPYATPAPPLPTGPLPKLGPVPTGDWTGINWIAIPGGHSPMVPATDWTQPVSTESLQGWSKGYSQFMWDPHNRTLTPWLSADGLTWKAGMRLDTQSWAPFFKEYDSGFDAASDARPHDNCSLVVTNFSEGPQALLLIGYVECNASSCAVATSDTAIWVSTDGLSWTPATIPKGLFSGAISGGSSGFLGIGTENFKDALWTSLDGRTWTKGALPPQAVASGSRISNVISMASGFVLSGVVTVKKGHQAGSGGGCGWAEDLSQYQAALWWSADGRSWTRDPLTHAEPTYLSLNMAVHAIDDHTAVAIESLSGDTGTTTIEWASNDGKSWTLLDGHPIDEIAAYLGQGCPCSSGGCIVAGRDRGLVYAWNTDKTAATLSAFNDRLALVALMQTGDLPWWDQSVVLVMGPSGILASDGGTRFWIGVPTVG